MESRQLVLACLILLANAALGAEFPTRVVVISHTAKLSLPNNHTTIVLVGHPFVADRVSAGRVHLQDIDGWIQARDVVTESAAKELLDSMVKLSPSSNSFQMRSYFYAGRGNYTKALHDLGRAMNLATSAHDKAEVLSAQYRMYMWIGDRKSALVAANECFKIIDRKDAERSRTQLLIHYGRLKEAGKIVAKAIARDRNSYSALTAKQTIEFVKGDFENAKRSVETWVRLMPNDAIAYCRRGQLLLLKGDAKGALANFETAIKKGGTAISEFAEILVRCCARPRYGITRMRNPIQVLRRRVHEWRVLIGKQGSPVYSKYRPDWMAAFVEAAVLSHGNDQAKMRAALTRVERVLADWRRAGFSPWPICIRQTAKLATVIRNGEKFWVGE